MPNKLKKILLPFLLLLSSIAAFAQPTQDEKKLLFNKIDTLLINYVKYSRFLEDGKYKITPGAINNFKQLFVSENVMLPDEMSPAYFDNGNATRPRVPTFRSMDLEVNKLNGKVPVDMEGKSLSKLQKFSDSLNTYFTGLEDGRNSFFQTYSTLDKNMSDYKSILLSKEKITNRSLNEFIVMTEANYPDGFSIKLLNSVVSFKNIENNEVKLLLEKKTYGKLYGSDVKLENLDTLLLTLQISQNYSKLLISKIEMIGYKLSFLNDNDHDFFSNAIDACPDESGLFTPTGCPPEEERYFVEKMKAYVENRNTDSSTAFTARPVVISKINKTEGEIARLNRLINNPPKWILAFGVSSGILNSTFTKANSGYNIPLNASVLASRGKDPVSVFSGGKSIGGEIMLESYFGEKKNIGLGAGLAFNSISGTIKKDEFHVEYMAEKNDESNTISGPPASTRNGGNSYTQIITAITNLPIEEKISVSNFAIPIMAIYRGKLTGKLGFKVEAGIALNLFYKSTMSSTNARFRYEAVYKYSNPYSSAGSQDFFDPGTGGDGYLGFNKSSWIIMNDFVKLHTSDPKAYFDALEGAKYPVGWDVKPNTENKSASFSPGVSFSIRPSICFNFNKGASLNVGVFYTNTSFSQSGNYRLINEKREYNTLMQGVSKTSNSNFGIHISYSYSLFYYLQKWTKELSGLR